MKIFYINHEYEIKAFIKEYLKNHNPQPTDDFINQIANHKQLKNFIENNGAKTRQFDASKNEDAVNGIKNATVKLSFGTVDSICDEAVVFALQFLSLFKELEFYKAPEQQEQNQQGQDNKKSLKNRIFDPQSPKQLSEDLKNEYNFSIPLGDNQEEKRARFKTVNNANGGADGGDKIFTDELGEALYCNNNDNALHVNTTALKANLENKNVQEVWWGILSDLGFYWDNEIKITEPSKGQNNADVIGKKRLNRLAIQEKIKEEERVKTSNKKSAFSPLIPAQHKLQQNPNKKIYNENNNLLIDESQEVDDKIFDINKLNGINFDDIEISKKTFTFDVKKYGSLFEIVAEDKENGGSYRFQLDEASANQKHYQAIYGSIQVKNDGYNFKADEGIQEALNKLLRANNIQKSNFFNNDVKKDAIINQDAKAYSYSYYRHKNKNTDINVNFGFLQQDIKNQNDFEKLIYEQGVKSEFFVKVNDTNNDEKYVKFSLYWDEDKGKPAIHLAKSLNGKNIKLYGSNQELCGSVAKNNADYFKDIEVSFQLYYNRGKTITQNDINKALYFINNAKISHFFDSSKASNLDLNSSIVTDKKATKEITAKERELTQEEKTVEIKKINQALEKGLKEAFSVGQGGVDNPLINSIAEFVKGDEDVVMPDEIKKQADKLIVNQLKEKYQAKLTDINKPANSINNQQLNQKVNQSNQKI